MNKKIVYPVTVDKVDKIKGDIIILQGGRATGKSYSVKYKLVRDAYNSIKDGVCNSRFVYLRRYHDDTKDIYSQTYFDDIDIYTITNGTYNCIIVYRHEIYFGNINDKGETTKEILIGRVLSITKYVQYKSQVFKNFKYVIFEEFISDTYQSDEPNKIFNILSSIFRNDKGICYMVGNNISRFNPYYREWGLTNALTQKIDTIDTYNIDGVTIKCWKCPSGQGLNKMIFGHAKQAVDGVTYETKPFPHLTHEIEDYDIIYTCVLKHNGFMYLLELLRYNLSYTWYIQPKTTPVQNNTRVISKEYNIDVMYTDKFTPLNKNEAVIFEMLKSNKIAYSDNLTGTEFSQIVQEYL